MKKNEIDALKSHVCSVKEIAVLYYEHVVPQVASRNLRRDIREYPALADAMKASGWEPRKRSFTPRQVETLIQYLGAPV